MYKKLLCLLVMVLTLTACQGQGQAYKPQTVQGTAKGMDGDITVQVTLSENRIESIEILDQNETSGICEKVYEVMPKAIIDQQSLNIDGVSGATVTSNAFLKAVENALTSAQVDLDPLKKVAKPNQAKDEEFTYDVVVAGGGLSGLIAAYEASLHKAKVALVEKNGLLGGTSITASGNMLVAQTDADKATMKKGWLDRSYAQELNPIDMDMLDALIERSPHVLDLYQQAGVDYRTEVSEKNGSTTVKINPNEASKKNAEAIVIPSKKANAKGGPALISALTKKLQELGVDIYLNTPVTDLINKDGQIQGLISSTEKYGTKTFHAKAVVLATGDYAHNKEMDEMYNKRGANEYSASAIGNTGDGHRLALAAGAVMNPFQESMSGVFNANPFDMPMVGDPTNGYPFEALLLNMEGKRVYREDGGSHPQKFEFVRTNGRNTAWCLMDSTISPNFVHLDDYLQATEKNHPIIRVYKADSIAELAEKMELDPSVVQAQVDQYNKMVAQGEDTDFGKNPKFLKAIEKGPFYGALLYDGTRGVYGGIKTNTKAEVVTKDGQAIPGLYASGVISSGQFFGDFYPGRQALGVASHMGSIAGESAATYALNK